MKITINGEPREVVRAKNVAELIEELALPVPAILAEHNGLALRRNEWPSRALAEGDRIAFINAGGYASAMSSNHCMRGDFAEVHV